MLHRAAAVALAYDLLRSLGIAGNFQQTENYMTTTQADIREILAQNGRLAVPVASLAADADLFAAGLDSLAIVNVLMSLEERFEIELPDEMLQRRSFASIATIEAVVNSLVRQAEHT